MQPPHRSRNTPAQRVFATAATVVLLFVGVLPALHHHEAEDAVDALCHDRSPTPAPHLETLAVEHPELCGLCCKTTSSARLERPQTALIDEIVAESLFAEGRQIPPPGSPGRHGASRAPPLA